MPPTSRPSPTSPAPATGRRAQRCQETRERIFRAALTLFARQGFFATTTEQITEAANVGQGTFFNYFPTKPHVLAMLAEIQLGHLSQARQRAEVGQESLETTLSCLMRQIMREPAHSRGLASALLAAFASSNEVRALLGQTMSQGRKEISAILTLGQRRGEIRTDRPASALALGFQRAIIGTLMLWVVQPKAELRDWLEEAFRDFWASAAARGEA